MNFIADIVAILVVLGMVYLVQVSDKLTNKLKQKAKDEKQNNPSLLFKKIEKLEEEVFLLQNNITYDSCFEKIFYSTDPNYSVFNNSYKVKVDFLPVKESNADNLIIEISLEGKVIKELEIYQVSFGSIRSIYEFISYKIKEMEGDEKNISFEFEKSDDFKDNLRDNLDREISKGVKII